MNTQEIDRRLKVLTEELEILNRAKGLLKRGFPFDADELESRISIQGKKIAMLREMRPKASMREAETAALGLVVSIYKQGKNAKLGENLEELGLWRHIMRIAERADAAREQGGGEEG